MCLFVFFKQWVLYKSFKVITPGVSLGVLSPQGRHSATYNEHMPMKELHTALQPTGPGKAPTTDPHDRIRAQPTHFASQLLWMLVPTQQDLGLYTC